MNWYWKVVDRMDSLWEPLRPNGRKPTGKHAAPSLGLISLSVVGLIVGGFILGVEMINTLQAKLHHDQFSFACGLVGLASAMVYCLSTVYLVLRSYSRAQKTNTP